MGLAGIPPLVIALLGGSIGVLLVVLGFWLPFGSWGVDPDPELRGQLRLAGSLENWRKHAWFVLLVAGTLFGGLALLFASLQFLRAEERSNQTMRRAIYGFNALLGTVLLLSVLGLLNLLAYTEPINRVTGRVATMARTHDLFVGGAASVSLGVLVSKLLPSLSVVKPAGAHVSTQIEAPDTRLATDRAVSLAMVLNELCWNALEHGVGETGTLELRARRSGESRLVLEVEDDGGRRAEPRADDREKDHAGNGEDLLLSRRERGMGLRLVEGLVSRELGGKFVLLDSGRGGTLARVDIPILDEGGNNDETTVADSAAGRLS